MVARHVRSDQTLWPAQESGQMGHCWPTGYGGGGGGGEVAPVRILPCLSDLTCPRFADCLSRDVSITDGIVYVRSCANASTYSILTCPLPIRLADC